MSETKVLTCIRCPRGCQVTVELDGSDITSVCGNACPRGEKYARAEVTSPVRTVTTTMPVDGSELEAMVSCKTATDVPKGRVMDVVEAIRQARAKAPVKIGDVLLADVAGTGVDVVATKNA